MDTILIVDDDQKTRRLAASCLEEHGRTPVFAKNGREALEVIVQLRPDAVVTDLHMPEMDGLELVEHMRRRFPGIPVVLMTSRGSEEIAVTALKAGALSYVPKKSLRTDLCHAMRIIFRAVEARRHRERLRKFLVQTESFFLLGYEADGPAALVSHLQGNLTRIDFCDETELFQISTALAEAIDNAIDHGNLELDSKLRERDDDGYTKLRQKRMTQPPYRDRRVQVAEKIYPSEVIYTIHDEGPGFDWTGVPDPRNPKNLLKPSGRGLMLIRTFMDVVTFNDTGNEITL
ncbi:MAG: response regulator, partial [bacterium]